MFSALRLAKFNIDERQTDNFIGLPTPANALFFISIPLILQFQEDSWMSTFLGHTTVLIVLCLVMSILLIAEIPLFSLKFKTLAWQKINAIHPTNQRCVIIMCFTFCSCAIYTTFVCDFIHLNKNK